MNQTKKCVYCGRDNDVDAVACRECGTNDFESVKMPAADGESPPPVTVVSRAANAGAPSRMVSFIQCAWVTLLLVGINLIVFLNTWRPGAGPRVLIEHGANWGPLTASGDWWWLLTSIFLHSGLFHLWGNMISLLILGALAGLAWGQGFFSSFIWPPVWPRIWRRFTGIHWMSRPARRAPYSVLAAPSLRFWRASGANCPRRWFANARRRDWSFSPSQVRLFQFRPRLSQRHNALLVIVLGFRFDVGIGPQAGAIDFEGFSKCHPRASALGGQLALSGLPVLLFLVH